MHLSTEFKRSNIIYDTGLRKRRILYVFSSHNFYTWAVVNFAFQQLLSSKCKTYTSSCPYWVINSWGYFFLFFLDLLFHTSCLSVTPSLLLYLSFSLCVYLSRTPKFFISRSFSSHLFFHFQYSVLSFRICLCQFITHYSYVTVGDNFFFVFLVLPLPFSPPSVSLPISLSLSLSLSHSLSLFHDLSMCLYIVYSFSISERPHFFLFFFTLFPLIRSLSLPVYLSVRFSLCLSCSVALYFFFSLRLFLFPGYFHSTPSQSFSLSLSLSLSLSPSLSLPLSLSLSLFFPSLFRSISHTFHHLSASSFIY